MLTDGEHKRIEAEEQVRHEVRKRLEAESPTAAPPPPQRESFGKRMLDFFNSGVGMWFLSSVVLTGGAALLQDIQHNHEIAQKNREQLQQHRFEIAHRLDQMEYGLRRATTVGDAKAALDGMFKAKFPLTPELQNRSLASLYLTMYQLLRGTEQQKSEQAMNFIRRLEEAELSLQSVDDAKPLDMKQKERLHRLVASVRALHLSSTPQTTNDPDD
ncbi:MAG: hypothetical protein FJX11_09930 [Alphaproteobacteria bacterium]|nr:hypothetical protein [Alphaproteobacteria bacterium]